MPSNGALDLTIRIMGKVDPSLAKSISSVTKQASSMSAVIGNIGKAGIAMTGAVAAVAAGVIGSTTKLRCLRGRWPMLRSTLMASRMQPGGSM